MHRGFLIMEQKRTLWIVAAAGIFLLVIVGAALIIYSPSLHNTPVQQASFDPSTGWVSAPQVSQAPATPAPDVFSEENEQKALPGIQDENQSQKTGAVDYPAVPDFNSQAKDTTPTINAQSVNIYTQETTTFDLNALKASGNTSNVVPQNQKTAEQIQSVHSQPYSQPATARTVAQQDNYYTPAPKTTAVKKTEAKPAPKKTEAKPIAKTSTAQKVAAAAKKNDLFWIQVGAYSSKSNADAARAVLEQNKIPVEVFTDSKYFKVRVGPYQTKSEAVFWQKRISEIGNFASTKTMVINSSTQK